MKYSSYKNFFYAHAGITFVLLAAFMLRINNSASHVPSWDEAVYLLMGKYIYSLGHIGIWEHLRPFVWPAIIGLPWKLHCDPVFWGKAIETLCSLGTIYFVYLLGKLIFNKSTGIIAALLFSFSPTFFCWGNSLYTDIPSLFPAVVSCYLFSREKYFFSGIILALAFLTRFTQALLLLPFIAALFIIASPGKKFFSLFRLCLGFLLPAIPFFIINAILYQSPFDPVFATIHSNIVYSHLSYEGPFYYIKTTLAHENSLLILYPISIFFVFQSCRRKRLPTMTSKKISQGPGELPVKKWLIVIIGLLFFSFIHLSRRHDIRYIIPALPYLYMVTAFALTEIFRLLKKKIYGLILFFIVLGAIIPFQYVKFQTMVFPQKQLDPFQKYVAAHEKELTGNIWISNPTMIVYSSLKPSCLIYYHDFTAKEARRLNQNLKEADVILFNRGDFPCLPPGDNECEIEKDTFIKNIFSGFDSEGCQKDASGTILMGIFKRRAAVPLARHDTTAALSAQSASSDDNL